eukprot:4312130-Alexandrium_andersonii.AAC.1
MRACSCLCDCLRCAIARAARLRLRLFLRASAVLALARLSLRAPCARVYYARAARVTECVSEGANSERARV